MTVNFFRDLRLDAPRFAVIDPVYRYWLHRRSMIPGTKGWTVFLMLNPSTADATRSDPTFRRCVEFSRRFDHVGVILVNLYAAKSTFPDDLGDIEDPVGTRNRYFIAAAANVVNKEGGEFICAWGAHKFAKLQAPLVLKFVREQGVVTKCLGLTKDGEPRHPLRLPGDTALEKYNG